MVDHDLLCFAYSKCVASLTGPFIAGGGGQRGQLPPLGKLNFFSIETPVKVCEVCPRRQKILGTALL